MATSHEYAAYVLEQLSEAGEITSRKMFGGVGVYVDGVFCAIIGSSNRFYLRVGPGNVGDFEAAGMPRFPGGKGAGMPYYEVPSDVLEDAETLGEWATRAREVALVAKRKS